MVSCVGNISRKASHLCDVFSLAEISLTAVSALLLLNPCIFYCYNFYDSSSLALDPWGFLQLLVAAYKILDCIPRLELVSVN